jgi:pimeloyl-ACP methyl ester carboxylesterase/DNA-binding CsgD family transcriptional regulator
MATLLVDEHAKIIAMNGMAQKLADRHASVRFDNGELRLRRASLHQRLLKMLAVNESSSAVGLPIPVTTGDKVSLMVMDIELDPSVHYGQIKLVLVAEASQKPNVALDYLRHHYGMTNAEARVAHGFVAGESLKDLADRHSVTYNTVRTQMKRVMAKVDVQCQSDLVREILSGPSDILSTGRTSRKHVDFECMKLADGRQLAWSEYGPRDGKPVILCHSSIWSRLQRHPDSDILHRYRIRLIVPDRPGYGRSDPHESRTLGDWADDLKALSDHLDIDRFGLVGIMLGADYALSSAASLGERITSVALLSARVSPTHCQRYPATSKAIELLEKLSVKSPRLLTATVKVIIREILRRPEPYIEKFMGKGGNKDQAAWNDGELKRIFIEAFQEANRQGVGEAFVQDWMILQQSDHYRLQEVHVPVSIWHGRHERLLSTECIEHVAESLPNSRLTIIEDDNKYVFHHQWPDAMKFLASV